MIYDAPHPAFPEPEDKNTRLWRYLDFSKFEWLAHQMRLFMPNAARLGDPLEGTQPAGHSDWWSSLAAAAKSAEERETADRGSPISLVRPWRRDLGGFDLRATTCLLWTRFGRALAGHQCQLNRNSDLGESKSWEFRVG
jgi:hypothetical protein